MTTNKNVVVVVADDDDGSLECYINATLGNLTENSILNVTCRQDFDGRWAPSIGCRFQKNSFQFNMADQSASKSAAYEGIVAVPSQFGGEQIVCELFFLHPQPWEYLSVGQALNRPYTSQTWTSDELVVLYGPKSISWTPDDSVFRVGDTLSSTSLANPPASFVWLNEYNDTITTGNTITFTDKQIGLWRMRCVASNGIGKRSIERQVYVYESELCDGSARANERLSLIIGLTLGVVIFLISILNVMLFLYIKRPGCLPFLPDADRTKTYRSKNVEFDNPDATSSITGSAGFGAGNDKHKVAPYQVISDGDVTSSVSYLPDGHSTFYEPFSIGKATEARSGPLPPHPVSNANRMRAGAKDSLRRFPSDQGVNYVKMIDHGKPKHAMSLNALNVFQPETLSQDCTVRHGSSIGTLESASGDNWL
ncbi:hypothetical protein LSH36_202g06007 [Paralvinella palmiformis]|uniref:Uncharacterized protein n=1 Tax=Paralvinella palmiformis TaxID=53620 RepID=A0AAD9JQ67_9ANNE|nr:hypothetical protein LSH36_202g06007 [Paralvinella palmiformis]